MYLMVEILNKIQMHCLRFWMSIVEVELLVSELLLLLLF